MARKKNTRNPQSNLFKQLTRLFSGPITDYRRQNPRKERRRQLDKYSFQSAGGLEFKKSAYDPYKNLGANFFNNQSRMERYIDFDQMEYSPELHSALDIYADEMTTSNEFSPLLGIACPNEEIRFTLENLYHNILNIDFNLFGWCRTMCKYGDYFLYLDIDDDTGIKNAIGLPAKEIERLEGEDPNNPNYVQFQWNSGGLTFENWQMAHFRILGNDKHVPYGTSVLDPARRIWRQLTLLEDAMMAYRIVRAPERRVFYIDTGNISPEDVEQYMQKVMTQMKRNQIVDPDTGRVDLRYNPMSVEEDYWVPVRGNTNTRIENLPGGTYTGDIDDVKYLRDKLFSAIKIPASYLSSTDEGGEDKTTLSQKDIRFARTIQRLQRAVVSELEKIGVIHLYTLGFRAEDLISFSLTLNNPSKIAELQELEHWRTKFDVASSATEGFFSKRWIFENLFNMSHEEINRVQREKFYDKKYDTALEGTTEEALGGGAGGAGDAFDTGGEGDLFDTEGGDDLTDAADTPDLDAPEPEAPEPEADDSPAGGLITAPGNRDDKNYKVTAVDPMGNKKTTTTASKGNWNTPVSHDRRTSSGPRKRQIKAKGDIPQPMKSLAKGIVAEELATTYKREEELLFQTKQSIDNLIAGLESKKKMKFKHNKKRNTAFVFESLVREVVKSVVSEDLDGKNKIIKTLKTFFNKDTELYKELQIYNSILETREMEKDIKEKVIKEARFQHSKLNKDKIFQSQTALINEINKNVTKDLFNNFVPNYKNLATIYNFLNLDVAPKKKVILENKLVEELKQLEEEKKVPTDKLTFKVFMKKYNEKYGTGLLNEQKTLLNKYITSFSDNGLGLKVFLNEEVGRIKTKLKETLETELVKGNEGIKEKILKVAGIVESLKNQPINQDVLKNILKIQNLLSEMEKND